ncbi:MAG TPA: serine/threonine-protein kinase [Bryobacteraceae bacterium]|nr:serine/threonine-protein kinase [Bryobacteraceae bacterium]
MIEKLGPYQIKAELGRGSGGIVYRAVDPASGEEVALKTLPKGGLDPVRDSTMMERLRREAESTAMLRHPNIVRVHSLREDQGEVYLVMEFVRGRSVQEALDKHEKFSVRDVARIISAAASALDFAHQSSIVHRDVKPANLMLTEDGGLKVMDFGAVKILHGERAELTTVGTAVGSPHYMSPEQIRGVGVDGRSDQFSLAVIAYELLAGRRPFAAESLAAILYQIADEQPAPLSSLRKDLPAEVDAVFARALAKKREERYPTCSAFAEDLSAAILPAGSGKKTRLWIAIGVAAAAVIAAILLLIRLK